MNRETTGDEHGVPHEASEVEQGFGVRAREILSRGASALGALPDPQELAALAPADRHAKLDHLRIELFGISSIMAEGAVRRSIEERHRYPPLGLARSLFSDFGVISASPSPISAEDITDFRRLGKALIDTTVFHLDGYLKQMRKSESEWLLDRLGKLLSLFRLQADRHGQARMRDSLSFLYGGLQFGTSTCVQLAEVMARMLASYRDLTTQGKAEVMKRSIRPAYDLAALNVSDVASAYSKLQPPSSGADPGSPSNPAGWMDPAKFSIKHAGGSPWKVVLAVDFRLGPSRSQPAIQDMRYTTRGCPARMSPSGSRSPIGRLWEWSVEVCHQAGLLETSAESNPR